MNNPKHTVVSRLFSPFPQKQPWLLLLLISIKRLRVENFVKDFQTGAKQTLGRNRSTSMRGAA